MASVFSLDSLRTVRPRTPVTLLYILAVLCVLELVARMLPDEALMAPRTRMGSMVWMERELLPRHPHPRVLILGSSRIRDGVSPKRMDDALALPPGSTLNLGLAGGRLFDAIWMYDRWQPQLEHSELVLLNIDEWFFNPNYNLGWLYETHAPLGERIRMPAHVRGSLTLDGLFQLRPKFQPILLTLKRIVRRRPPAPLAFCVNEENQVVPLEERSVDPTLITDDRFRRTADFFYYRYETSPVLQDHLAQLAERIRAHGGKLVLIQTPNSATYQQFVDKQYASAFQAHLSALRDTAQRLNLPLRIWLTPQECGLDENDFEDYGHLIPSGTRKLSQFLAETIRKEQWLSLGEATARSTSTPRE